MNTAEQNYRLLQEIDANRSFMLMAYQQNPKLLEHAEVRIKQMFEEPACRQNFSNSWIPGCAGRTRQRGASLIELIMFIVIVSTALAGILLVMDTTTKGSADPLIRKQAIAAAYSLLEEVELQDFFPVSGVTPACTALPPNCNVLVLQADRASVYHTVSDYDGFATTGIFSLADAASASAVLANYDAVVAISGVPLGSALGSIAAGSAVQIDVTVTNTDNGEAITATGYRTAY